MSVKEKAIVTVSVDANGQLVLSDNEGHCSEPGKVEKFETDVTPNGKIGWKPGKGIQSISAITIDSGEDIFKKLPREKDGKWIAKIDCKESGESKYSITYIAVGSKEPVTIDPVIRIKPPGG